MATKTIGEFIQFLRKEKGLTQKELAEKVNVSDKTISKWENGNSTPDIGMLKPLCDALEISVNELISGEKLLPEEYSKKAEENIMTLLSKNRLDRRASIIQYTIGGILAVLTFVISVGNLRAAALWYLDFASLVIPVGISVSIALLSGKRDKRSFVVNVRKTIIPAGVLTSVVGLVSVLGNLSDTEYIGAFLSVSMLTVLYALVIYLIFYTVEQHMEK